MSNSSYHCRWRIELTEQICEKVKVIEGVKAIVIGGSVGRGYADEYSDLEIRIFWDKYPDENTRKLIVKKLNAEYFYPYNYEGREDNVIVNGFRIDYIEFFDNKAFADGSEFTGCYCTWYHWNEELEAECSRCSQYEQKCFKRELAKVYIQKGLMEGYLAYIENKVVGWCNANNRANYDRLSKKNRPDLWEDYTENEQVKSIVCFIVAPSMRGIGIAAALLKAVCEDALVDGFDYIEAYPAIGEFNQLNYHGPFSMYEKQGFVLHKNDKEIIARKYLK